MKKIIIAVILLFIAFSASAQLHADLRVGATASSFGDRHLKMGIRAGAGVEYLFSEHWGLRSGLFFLDEGATTSNNVFNYDSDKATRLSYLDLPVEALVAFRLSARTRLALHGDFMSPVCSTLLCPTVPGSTFVAGMQGWASVRISSSDISSSVPKYSMD